MEYETRNDRIDFLVRREYALQTRLLREWRDFNVVDNSKEFELNEVRKELKEIIRLGDGKNDNWNKNKVFEIYKR